MLGRINEEEMCAEKNVLRIQKTVASRQYTDWQINLRECRIVVEEDG